MKELIEIQSRLKAKKSQFNKFGKYSYRSCEDILEALKPLTKETGTHLTMTDSITEVGGRIYVQATVTLENLEGVKVTVNAFAREADEQKGMSAAQITGSSSSYARKYALSGLFLIDDSSQDPDAQKPQETVKVKVLSHEDKVIGMIKAFGTMGLSSEQIAFFCNCEVPTEITPEILMILVKIGKQIKSKELSITDIFGTVEEPLSINDLPEVK